VTSASGPLHSRASSSRTAALCHHRVVSWTAISSHHLQRLAIHRELTIGTRLSQARSSRQRLQNGPLPITTGKIYSLNAFVSACERLPPDIVPAPTSTSSRHENRVAGRGGNAAANGNADGRGRGSAGTHSPAFIGWSDRLCKINKR
jgi:hypothetical protein